MQEKITIMVNYYIHKNLNDMIREVEREFPLENSFFPTKNIRNLIANPDYPDDEGRECGEPFLNQRWIDVPAIQWYDNAEFVSFATSRALAYFFPSIIRNSYMEEISRVNNYMADAEEWMMNKLIVVCFSERIRTYVQKEVNYIYRSYTKNQLEIVRKWILFQNKDNYFADSCNNALKILDSEIKNKN